jgi:hypothetical protein
MRERLETRAMDDFSPLEEDVWLKGTLIIHVVGRNGKPLPGKVVHVQGCGFS